MGPVRGHVPGIVVTINTARSGKPVRPAGSRRLLVIADLRHASPRWPALLGGLILRGWEVTVITAPLGEDAVERLGFPHTFASTARIVEVGPSSDVLEPVRRLLWVFGLRRRVSLTEQVKEKLARPGTRRRFDCAFQLALALIGWPDLQSRWQRPAQRAAAELLAAEPFDVLLSSSPYPTSHVVAAAIKRRHPELRWIADFRDLWAENHNYAMPAWRRVIDRRWERAVLKHADALTAPTQTWAEQLSVAHGTPAACVPNGFVDYEEVVDQTPKPSGRFELLYSGVRYPEHQTILPLLEAIAHLQQTGTIDASSFRFRWIGPFDSETALKAAQLGIQSLILQEPPVSRAAARRAQREAHALLFLQWQDPAIDWSSSLKLHEYVGAGRRIIATGGFPDSEVSRLLMASGYADIASSAHEVETALQEAIIRFRSGMPLTAPPGWEATARRLSGVSRGMDRLEAILLGN